MTPKDKYVVLGGTGDLGKRITEYLVKNPNIETTILVRRQSLSKAKSLALKGAQVVCLNHDLGSNEFNDKDYESLLKTLKGTKVIISTISNTPENEYQTQLKIAEIGKKLGIERFVPADFSVDITNIKEGEVDKFDSRIKLHNELQNNEKLSVPYTFIYNGSFMEDLYQSQMVDWEKKRINFYGDKNQEFDFTSYDNVARFTVDTLTTYFDESKNKKFEIVGDTASPVQLRDTISDVYRTKFELNEIESIDELEKEIDELKQKYKDNPDMYLAYQFMRVLCNGEGKLKEPRNDLLKWKPTTLRNFIRDKYERARRGETILP